jgi:hypothetical protein
VALIVDCKEMHIRKESLDEMLSGMKGQFAGVKKSLKKDMDTSINDSVRSMYRSPLAREMMIRRNEVIEKDTATAAQVKKDLVNMCKALRKCLAGNNFESADRLISKNSIEKYEEEIQKLTKDTSKEIDFINEIQKLKQVKVDYSYDPMALMKMIKINISITKPNRLIQFDRNKNTAVIYNIDTQKLAVTVLDSEFILPFCFMTVEVNGSVYLSGGDNNHGHYLKSLYFYDEVRGGLIPMENMEIGRSRHGLVAVEGKVIYSLGGETTLGVTNHCEAYDIKDNTWRTVPKLIEARCGPATCYTAGKIYAMGGWDKYYLDSIEVLDIEKNAWAHMKLSKKNTLPELQYPGAAVQQSGHIMIFGGYKEGEVLSKDTFIIDPKTGKVEKGQDLKVADAFVSSEVRVIKSTVYAFGYTKGGIHAFDENEWKHFTHKELVSLH